MTERVIDSYDMRGIYNLLLISITGMDTTIGNGSSIMYLVCIEDYHTNKRIMIEETTCVGTATQKYRACIDSLSVITRVIDKWFMDNDKMITTMIDKLVSTMRDAPIHATTTIQ